MLRGSLSRVSVGRVLGQRGVATKKSKAQGEALSTSKAIFDTSNVTTVGGIIDASQDFMPDKDLFRHVESGDKWTYKETREHINATANGLPEAGVLPKKSLALIQQNDTENFVTRLGATRAGIIASHIDIRLFHDGSVHHYLDSLQPRSLVLTPKYDVHKKVDVIDDHIPQVPENWWIGHPLRLERYPDLKLLFHTHKYKVYDGWYFLKDLFWYDETPRTHKAARIDPRDPAEVYFSRFNSKATEPMQFSHESVVQSAYNLGSIAPLSDKRVFFATDFCNPETQTMALSCIAYGSYMVVSTFWFRARQAITDLSQEVCSVLVATPSYLEKIVSHPLAKEKKFSLETIIVINSPLERASADLIANAQSVLGASRVDTAFTCDGSMAPFLYQTGAGENENALGTPIPNSEVIVADQNGKPLPVGQTGRLKTKGVHTLQGYYRRDSCDIIDSEKWLDSGVDGKMNADGSFEFVASNVSTPFTFTVPPRTSSVPFYDLNY